MVGKRHFDSDPINRRKSGTRCYRIYRPTDDPHYVIVDLEFDNITDAEAALAAYSCVQVHLIVKTYTFNFA